MLFRESNPLLFRIKPPLWWQCTPKDSQVAIYIKAKEDKTQYVPD